MSPPILNFVRWYPVISLILASALFSVCSVIYNYYKVDSHIPITLTAVHHLGSDYRISEYYVDKFGGNSVNERGYSGIICCRMLPRNWTYGLRANVRWEVRHIITSPDPATPKTEEVVGIYQAQVPVEKYFKPDRLWVHFFPKGRVRLVVSPDDSDSENHPTFPNDEQAAARGTIGTANDTLFTEEEITAFTQDTSAQRKKSGGWR